jgi:hypothetical protein
MPLTDSIIRQIEDLGYAVSMHRMAGEALPFSYPTIPALTPVEPLCR